MTMKIDDIIAHAQKINTQNDVSPVYHITPINDQITELSNNKFDVYNIPTNKISDIHAILCIHHPNKDYSIRCNNTINNDIAAIYSHPHHPTTILIAPPNIHTIGYYTLNMDRITPIECNQISIMQAINIAHDQINTQFNFIQHHQAIYGQTAISHMIYPCKCKDISIRYRIYNIRYSQDIHINIHTYHQNIMVYMSSFFLSPNNVHNIDASITHSCNNIFEHLQRHPKIYCNPHNSQHQYIALLRAAKDYFTQPNHSLRASIHQALQNFQQHYTYRA